MDASVELIRAAVDVLRADATISGYVAGRIFDRVPESGVVSPYISLGPSTAIPDDFDCMDGEEITIQFDVWSWGSDEAYGSMEARKLSGAVKKALHDAELTLADNALVTLQHEITRITRDPDGITNHGVIQFTATVETP